MSAMRVDAKVVMLGKESVGKTSLVERYVHHRFLVGPYQNVSVCCLRFDVHVRLESVTVWKHRSCSRETDVHVLHRTSISTGTWDFKCWSLSDVPLSRFYDSTVSLGSAVALESI